MTNKTSFPKEKIRILLLEGIHTNAVDVFQKAGYTNVERLTGALPSDELAEKIKDVHMVGVRSRSQIKGRVLDAAQSSSRIPCIFCKVRMERWFLQRQRRMHGRLQKPVRSRRAAPPPSAPQGRWNSRDVWWKPNDKMLRRANVDLVG